MRAARLFPLLVALWALSPAMAVSLQGQSKKEQDKDKEATVDEAALDEKILREAKLPVDGPALLKYFRDRTYKEADPKRLAELIRQLGDKDFQVREKAYQELLTRGSTALAALKEAMLSKDEEVAKRAAEL